MRALLIPIAWFQPTGASPPIPCRWVLVLGDEVYYVDAVGV